MIKKPMEACEALLDFHCPRYEEISDIGLYMDQVVRILEEALEVFAVDSEEKTITPSMVNNYVKQGIISPPVKKKYDRNHLAYLLVVCLLKRVYTMTEICRMIDVQIQSTPIEQAYNAFCIELERSLRYVVLRQEEDNPFRSSPDSFEGWLLRSAVLAAAHKIYVQKMIAPAG